MNENGTGSRRNDPVNVPVLGSELPQYHSRLLKAIGRFGLRISGWHFKGEIPNVPKLVAIGAFHTSNWDVVVAICAFWALGIKLSWMMKDNIYRWPLRGMWDFLGAVPVRRNAASGFVGGAIEQFERHDQFVLALAPEGTRSKVQRWKTGFYHIAHGAQVPILCVGIDFGRKELRFREPLYPSGDLAADLQLIDEFYADVTAKYPHLAR